LSGCGCRSTTCSEPGIRSISNCIWTSGHPMA
jgi:hypothetical protein